MDSVLWNFSQRSFLKKKAIENALTSMNLSSDYSNQDKALVISYFKPFSRNVQTFVNKSEDFN